MTVPEQPWRRVVRIVIGVLLMLEAIVALGLAGFSMIFVPLMGGMSMVYGGAEASDEQIKQTWWLIWFIAAAPFLEVLLLVLGAIGVAWNRRWLVYISMALGMGLYLYFAHKFMHGDWTQFPPWAALPLVLPVAGVVAVSRRTKVENK